MLTGEASGDGFGLAVASAGDVDGDGLAELLVGAPDAGDHGQGGFYYFSGATLRDASGSIAAADADGQSAGTGWDDGLGRTLTGGEDFDGDGFDEIVVGQAYGARLFDGASYASDPFGAVPSSLWTATDQVVVHLLPDVDGDGLADLLLGEPGSASEAGKAYLVLGSYAGLGTSTNPEYDSDATIAGEETGAMLGYAVGGADVDGDGLSELVLGAPHAAALCGSASGAVLVYQGGTALSGTVTEGYATFCGWTADQGAGFDLAGLGDLDADGFDDILLGTDDAGSPIANYAALVMGDGIIEE